MAKARIKSPYYWLAESLLDEPSLIEKAMFGCDAFYLHGRLKLVLCAGAEEPWKGVLIPTEREFHESLIDQFPELESHSVLGKWLYLAERAEDFEDTGERLCRLILRDDPRIGVEPEIKRKRKSKKKRSTTKKKK